MKTVTEFTGLEIKKLLKIQAELMKTAGAEVLTSTSNAASEPKNNPEEKNTAVQSNEELVSQEISTEPNVNEGKVHNSSPDNTIATVSEENAETVPETELSHTEQQKSTEEAPVTSNEKNIAALKPQRPSWKDRAEALRPQLINALKNEFSWKNEDRFNLAIDASRAVNPKMQERLRKVTALKKDKEEEKAPKFALEVGELIFIADYLIIKQEKDERKGGKSNNKNGKKKSKGKKKFKHKPFNDDDKKPSKRVKKPIPNPVKSNNKTVAVEKK
ncbi:MAG TPA: hypothetical protein PKC21_10115 [Oligoflexia bacterium]|nr:hypothetical protein [Oligoflexia bacterium]HMR25694.1 hypothetical protein [Oligoflexia bacterium]